MALEQRLKHRTAGANFQLKTGFCFSIGLQITYFRHLFGFWFNRIN